MPKAPNKDSSELLQIVTLTFAMTGGGFALLTLVLKLFLNPGAAADAQQAETSYGNLTKALLEPQNTELRRNAKRTEKQDLTQTLAEIVKAAGDFNGMKFPNFPQTTIKSPKAGLEEHRIKISVDPAKLSNILMFVAAVQDRKKTIQVESVSFKRDNKSKGDENLWTAI